MRFLFLVYGVAVLFGVTFYTLGDASGARGRGWSGSSGFSGGSGGWSSGAGHK
ncbi:hypothetical protein [Cupriavidus sp. RAF12]|uniref:hypothetical protein n=1 Tax=Cupriavidus sp. RAF12 TaxID=3233050 RepID=UPI003F922C4C